MKFEFSKKIKSDFRKQSIYKTDVIRLDFEGEPNDTNLDWARYAISFPILFLFIGLVIFSLVNTQIISYVYYRDRSNNNQFEIVEVKPNRGLIVDRNGRKLAQNSPAVSVYISTSSVIDESFNISSERLTYISKNIEEVLGNSIKSKGEIEKSFRNTWEKYNSEEKGWVKRVEVLSQMPNEVALKIKAAGGYLSGVTIEDGSKREYPYKESLAHIVGYTGSVYFEDLSQYSYITFNDVIGRYGLEKQYDEYLFGKKGEIALERDSLGNIVDKGRNIISESESGATLHTTLDIKAQTIVYNALKKGVRRFGAAGGAAIVQDLNSGEIISIASYPSFDSNLFVGGISEKDYKKVLKSGKNPLLNRAISAQVPPGSTFKTIVAAAALDSKAIDTNTIYVSRKDYTFSDGRPFPEFGGNSYGSLNVVSALMRSSNIFFCETIRKWDMDKLVPYLEKFGIGSVTGIDLEGEGAGRLPSPKNKIELAKTTSPWLDPVWYPEGDSCNSVIGQGITTVTPIQMVNWISAIANGGTLNTPHIGKFVEYDSGKVVNLTPTPIRSEIAGKEALNIVKEGMWSSVNGVNRVIIPLYSPKKDIAAKTGTAEFGRVDSEGRYEHTHAWVTGFFPYNKPKYSFVVFLEDGGASNNSATVAKEFIDWLKTYR